MLTFLQFLSEAKRPSFEVHKPEHFDYGDADDDHYYHVTRAKSVPFIKKHGIHPRRFGGSMADGFYANYSKGKAFLTDRSGVKYWTDKVGDHLEHQHGYRPKLAVIRFPKHWVPDAQHDELGSRDSTHPSHFVTHPITPPGHILKETRHSFCSPYKAWGIIHPTSGEVIHGDEDADSGYHEVLKTKLAKQMKTPKDRKAMLHAPEYAHVDYGHGEGHLMIRGVNNNNHALALKSYHLLPHHLSGRVKINRHREGNILQMRNHLKDADFSKEENE